MSFRITGLPPEPFRHLFGLSDEALAREGARRCTAYAKPGYPDRITLRDAEVGETLILLNHVHQPADTPYRASHAVFLLETATQAFDRLDEVPEALSVRPISLRAFDAGGEMTDAELVDGAVLAPVIERLLSAPGTAYLHAHYAKRGCYAARIERA